MEWIFTMIVFCMNYNIQLPLRASRRFFELAKGCLPQRKFELISFGIFGYNGRSFQLDDFQLWSLFRSSSSLILFLSFSFSFSSQMILSLALRWRFSKFLSLMSLLFTSFSESSMLTLYHMLW